MNSVWQAPRECPFEKKTRKNVTDFRAALFSQETNHLIRLKSGPRGKETNSEQF